MSNSLVSHAVGYIANIFLDIRPLYSKEREWERDKTRLTHELVCNGLAVLTIHLPALSKHFDKCLDQKEYSSSSLYLGGIVSKRVKVPAFLRSLYLLVFDNEGKLRDDPSIEAIAAIRQLFKGLTKVKLPCTRRRTIDELKEFTRIEALLRYPTLSWLDDRLDSVITVNDWRDRISFASGNAMRAFKSRQATLPGIDEPLSIPESSARILQQVCDRIASSLGDFHDESHRDYPKHGKGRVSNQPKEVSKYSFGNWPEKLDLVFPFDRYARYDYGTQPDEDRDRERRFRNHEPPSKLIAVPKTQKGPRLIASEPNMHQWIQGLVANQLTDRANRTVLANCLDISDQRHNQSLAMSASISGSHATVDLKSASDRLSLWTIERAFRSNKTFLDRMHACRTRTLSNAIEPSLWKTIILKKAFTQGSALTFPGQSVVYSMMAIASVIISNNQRVTSSSIRDASKQVRIYGDDIIIPVHSLDVLRSILKFCQLEVNSSKTYCNGKFRESCGSDAYDGVDVTPKYVKMLERRPDHEKLVSAIEASNNLHLGGWWHLAGWQASVFDRHRNAVPIIGPHDHTLGIKSFCGRQTSHLKSRWNSNLHITEFLALRLVGKTRKGDTAGSYRLYQFFIDQRRPRPFSRFESGTIVDVSSVMRKGWVPLQP